jgi:ATP-dependent Clp protease ATP-binding subunit ClpA
MFERFNDQARQSAMAAHSEAYALEANAIEPQHILLGLLGSGDELVTVLTAAGLTARTTPPFPPLPRLHIPFTPGSKKVFERALEESRLLGDREIRPGHLLLALLRDEAEVKALHDQGVDVDSLRTRVTELLRRA